MKSVRTVAKPPRDVARTRCGACSAAPRLTRTMSKWSAKYVQSAWPTEARLPLTDVRPRARTTRSAWARWAAASRGAMIRVNQAAAHWAKRVARSNSNGLSGRSSSATTASISPPTMMGTAICAGNSSAPAAGEDTPSPPPVCPIGWRTCRQRSATLASNKLASPSPIVAVRV